MKICVVDPTTKSRACFFTIYGEDCSFHYQHILNSDHPEVNKISQSDYIFICFDAFKTMRKFDQKFGFLYDVEILYRLGGYDFRDLIHLGEQVFGESRMYDYREYSSKINAHLNSFRISKIDARQYQQDQLIPADLIQKFYAERASLIFDLYADFKDNQVIDFYKDQMFSNIKALHHVSKKPLLIDTEVTENIHNHYISSIKKNVIENKLYLKFNAVGAKTGRLTFRKGSPNIYGIPKKFRNCIVAPKDCKIYQFDYKSFQPRLAIFSTEDESFKDRFRNTDDIYSIFPGDRSKNKIAFIAWMFSNMKNEMFGSEAKPIQALRTKLFKEASATGRLTNYFGRVLHFSDEKSNVVFQNYITSLEVDVILTITRWINKVLFRRHSRILFPFHDAIVMQINDNEETIVKHIKHFMESFYINKFGTKFPVEVSCGRNLGELDKE